MYICLDNSFDICVKYIYFRKNINNAKLSEISVYYG